MSENLWTRRVGIGRSQRQAFKGAVDGSVGSWLGCRVPAPKIPEQGNGNRPVAYTRRIAPAVFSDHLQGLVAKEICPCSNPLSRTTDQRVYPWTRGIPLSEMNVRYSIAVAAPFYAQWRAYSYLSSNEEMLRRPHRELYVVSADRISC